MKQNRKKRGCEKRARASSVHSAGDTDLPRFMQVNSLKFEDFLVIEKHISENEKQIEQLIERRKTMRKQTTSIDSQTYPSLSNTCLSVANVII